MCASGRGLQKRRGMEEPKIHMYVVGGRRAGRGGGGAGWGPKRGGRGRRWVGDWLGG